jgi:hypothetical protein
MAISLTINTIQSIVGAELKMVFNTEELVAPRLFDQQFFTNILQTSHNNKQLKVNEDHQSSTTDHCKFFKF